MKKNIRCGKKLGKKKVASFMQGGSGIITETDL